MTEVENLLQAIEGKRQNQDQLIAQLRQWEAVKSQGINIDTVKSFGFDPALLTMKQQAVARKAAFWKRLDPITGQVERFPYRGERLPGGKYSCRVFNYVRHHDGTTTLLDPILKAF